MNDTTYIKLFRKLLTWEWYTDANTFRVFMHILLKVNHKPGRYKGHDIAAGECVFGRKKWAEELGLSEGQVRTAMEHLKSTNEITTRATNKFTIVTVEKWEFWQIGEGKTANKTASNRANEQPTSNQQTATSKECKNNKNVRSISSSLRSEDIYSGLPAELREALADYEEMRRRIRKPMTDRARQLLLGKLDKLSGGNTATAVAILEQSTMNSWQGVFELRSARQNNPFTDMLRNGEY